MRHRWKWISALIIAAILGFGSWLRHQPARPALSGSIPASPLSAPALLTPAWPGGISSPAVVAHGKPDHSDEIEVCGIGKVKLDPDDLPAHGNYFEALSKSARLHWLATLRKSDDDRARAGGLYLEGILDRDSPQKDSEAARGELVQLAAATKDPAIFALAYIKCAKDGGDLASCPQFNLDDWAHSDADNAVPWLQLAAKARREGDGTAEASAMAHAAQAHQYQTYSWSVFSFAQSAMPNDVTATERWILTTQVIGVEAAMLAPFQPLFQYCSHDAQSDIAVHRQCSALAELMVGKAATLLDLSVGKSLGARVGWPAERVDGLTQETKASMWAINEMTGTDPKQQWTCDGVARGNAYMTQLAELGERGLARQGIEDSGESVAELSRKYDEWLAAMVHEAAAQP
jgi:hypothetical protein